MRDSDDSNTGTGVEPTIVRIAYRSLAKPAPDDESVGGRVYYWPFREPPAPGQWVIVPGAQRPENYAIVTGFGSNGEAHGSRIETITGLAPEEAVAETQRRTDAAMVAWLWVAQRAAGFPAPGYCAPPDDYPYAPIPPATGPAPSAEVAGEYASVWQRVHRGAVEYGLPLNQVKRFKSISERWLAISQSWPSETDHTSRPSDASSETEPTEGTGAAVTTTSKWPWKWLLVLAAVVLVVVILVALIRFSGREMNPGPDEWGPISSRPTTSRPHATCYRNTNGECVPLPSASNSLPGRATAECRDGTYSFARHRSGACASHGGVEVWLGGPA